MPFFARTIRGGADPATRNGLAVPTGISTCMSATAWFATGTEVK
jgi:hypothetical protein